MLFGGRGVRRLSIVLSTQHSEPADRYGKPQLITPRLGQGGFRAKIADIYHRRCAVTRERTFPALEAAHIRPYGDGGTHDLPNGLLLRSDLHSLFDSGYVTISPKLQFEVSKRVKEDFGIGRDYFSLHGESIYAPEEPEWRPDPVALTWHNDHRFLG